MTLDKFPYYDSYDANKTARGYFCIVNAEQDFSSNCKLLNDSAAENATWIVGTTQQDILSYFGSTPYNYHITGFVLFADPHSLQDNLHDVQVVATGSDDQYEQAKTLLKKNSDEPFEAELKHSYIIHCTFLFEVQHYYVTLSFLWLGLLIAWILWTWCVQRSNSMFLQKTIVVLPVLKLLCVFLSFLYIFECPWEGADIFFRYVMMALISLTTIFQTVFIAMLMVLSNGWALVRTELSREQTTRITILSGGIYLAYSAFYVSGDMSDIKYVIWFILVLFYAVAFVHCLRSLRLNINTVRVHLAFSRRNDVHFLDSGLMLKRRMLNFFFVLVTMYFLFKFAEVGVMQFWAWKYERLQRNLTVASHIADLSAVFVFMLIFRSRNWPQFFGLGLVEAPLLQGEFRALPDQQIAPILQTLVNDKTLSGGCGSDPNSRSGSISMDEPVLILNPVADIQADRLEIEEQSEAIAANCQIAKRVF